MAPRQQELKAEGGDINGEEDIKKLTVRDLEDLPGPKSKEELDEMKMPYEEYCRKALRRGQ